MSLKLELGTTPVTEAKATCGRLFLRTPTGTIEMPYADFCALVTYVLSNEDLKSVTDPRLELLPRLNKAKVIPGWNSGGHRIDL